MRARLTSPSYFSRLKRGWRSLDVGMRWKFCILLALILVVIAATAYQAWQGYESWIVFGVILAYLALAIAVEVITRLLERAGLLKPLAQVWRGTLWLVKACV